MTLPDLEDYIKVKDQAFADYEDQQKWKKMMFSEHQPKPDSSPPTELLQQYNRGYLEAEINGKLREQ